MPITIHVPGTPRAWPRALPIPVGRGKFRVVATVDPEIKLYRNAIKGACERAMRSRELTEPMKAVRISFFWYFASKNPYRFGQWHTAVPDVDNLMKIFMDAAKDAGLLPKGDQRVCAGDYQKRWARDAGSIFVLEALPDAPIDEEPDDLGAEPFRRS